jgi:PAS domain S-box-containing protein
MSDPGSQLLWLRDPRLAPLALSALPAWLWSLDAACIIWANPVGATLFGAPNATELARRTFHPSEPAAAQVAWLGTTLPPGAAPRLERLRGFGAGIGPSLSCNCSQIELSDGTAAILIAASDHAGPDLTVDERVRRLLAGCDEPIAAFSVHGTLINASPTALPRLGDATSLSALGAEAHAAAALRTGLAAADTPDGPITIHRIRTDVATILIASFAPHRQADEPVVTASEEPTVDAPAAEAEPIAAPGAAPDQPSSASEPATPSEPQPASNEWLHPLRFVWQMDAERRFTLVSDDFITLLGPRTASVLGRPWDEITSELGLDPEGQIARAVATHDTWSGLTVTWPVDDSPDRLVAELSGLPVFDRDRLFRGYRGFGVCRDLARLTELANQRRSAPVAPAPVPAVAEIPATAVSPTVAVERPALTPVPRVENVVPFRPASDPETPALSQVERRAFRELARRLTERLTTAGIAYEAKLVEEEDGAAEPAPAEPAPADPTLSDLAAAAKAASHAGDPADTGAPSDFDEDLRDETSAEHTQSAAAPTLLLDRLPVGVLVYRLSHLLYANRMFLEWAGYQTVDALAAAGGLDALFIEPGVSAFEEGGRSFAVASNRGDKPAAEARLLMVPWDGDTAFALVTTIAEDRPAPANAALASAQAEAAELKSILDTATDGVIVLDRTGRILSSNRSGEALFGYDSRELAGRAFTELFVAESEQVASDYLEGLLRNDVASVLNDGREVIGRVRQGGLISLFMTMGRIGDGADKLCAVFRDITPWKKVEEDLTDAKRQAEKASSAKSDFLAKISHEIRTPLNAIIGFSEVMMEERFGPVGNERYRQYLHDIHTSGGHLLSLLNDLLDLSKIEAGKLDLSFAGVALNDLTQQCVAIMQPQANRDRIIIRTSLLPKLPQVIADARSVRQIVLNLLSNSIKFTGAGGQVIVSTARTDRGEVVLRVRDTGIGMSEKDIATALEPFRQIATTTRGGVAGTGLGLPLTKALAEANRANFGITSAPAAGTLVEVTFPATRVLAE